MNEKTVLREKSVKKKKKKRKTETERERGNYENGG